MRRRGGATLLEVLIASAVLALIAGPLAFGLVALTRAERDLSLALDRATGVARAVRRVMRDGSASTGFVKYTTPQGEERDAFRRRDGRFVVYARTDGRLTRTVVDASGRALDAEVLASGIRYLHLAMLERGLHFALEAQPEAPAHGPAPRRLEVATAVAVRGW